MFEGLGVRRSAPGLARGLAVQTSLGAQTRAQMAAGSLNSPRAGLALTGFVPAVKTLQGQPLFLLAWGPAGNGWVLSVGY